MSIKAKTCPFCGISLENIPPSKVFYHVNNGCILSSENFSINDIEKWNTRKPMQDIVERLEAIYEFYDEKKKEAYDDKDWEDFDLNMHINRGVYEALAIVKKVGGMNESNNTL